MDHFITEFRVRPLKEHYKQELERMRSEVVPDDKANMETLSSRAFKVQHIFAAAGDLEYLTYVSAVISPFPEDSPIIQSLYQRTLHITGWPAFFAALKEVVSSKERWGVEVFSKRKKAADSGLKSALKGDNSGSPPKKLSWAEMRAEDNRGKNLKRKFIGSRMNAVHTAGGEEQDGLHYLDEEEEHEEEDETFQFQTMSKMNTTLRMENESLRKQLTAVQQQPAQDHTATALISAINTMTSFMQSQSNQNYRSNSTSSLPSTSDSQVNSIDSRGVTSNPGNSRKRSRVNSNKLMDKQGGGGAKNMDKYGPGGGARGKGDPIDRYQHNPAGPESWKRWLRVCNNCGCYGAHFGTQCQGTQRPNFNRQEDPRKVQPIEQYPPTREAALVRCRQEYRMYGSRVRWNCKDQEAPTPQELA